LFSEAVLDGMKTMVEKPTSDIGVEEIWVNTNEAAEITGYFYTHVRKLARDNWNLPEDQRVIRVRRRVERYEIWLPDLIKYKNDIGKGPHSKAKNE
jgi:hypothetical protein